MDHSALIRELRERVKNIKPLEGEEDFITSGETLTRFLKAREWKVRDAEKLLKATIEWRRETKPLQIDCRWCHEKPGFHCMRQIGFDELHRPVVYSCFAQASASRNGVEDSIAHVTYLIENAKRTMRPSQGTWVFIVDCTGMTLPMCNPKQAYSVAQVLSNFYPERLGLVICINHNPIFQGVWKAVKAFIHANTASKVHLVRSKKKMKETFSKYFNTELTEWLTKEIKLNKRRPLIQQQKEFWRKPESENDHDPRGCPSYVANYIQPILDGFIAAHDSTYGCLQHMPHPNIVDTRFKDIKADTSCLSRDDQEVIDGASANNVDSDSEGEDDLITDDVEISKEFQIPQNAKPIHLINY